MRKKLSIIAVLLVSVLAFTSCMDANSQLKSAAEQFNKEFAKVNQEGVKGMTVNYDEATKTFAIKAEVEQEAGESMQAGLKMMPELKDKTINGLKESLVGDNEFIDALKEVNGVLKVT